MSACLFVAVVLFVAVSVVLLFVLLLLLLLLLQDGVALSTPPGTPRGPITPTKRKREAVELSWASSVSPHHLDSLKSLFICISE